MVISRCVCASTAFLEYITQVDILVVIGFQGKIKIKNKRIKKIKKKKKSDMVMVSRVTYMVNY